MLFLNFSENTILLHFDRLSSLSASLALLPSPGGSRRMWKETDSSHLCAAANQFYLRLIICGLYSFGGVPVRLHTSLSCKHAHISVPLTYFRTASVSSSSGHSVLPSSPNKSVFHGNQSTMVVSSCSPSPNWPLWPVANQFHSWVSCRLIG